MRPACNTWLWGKILRECTWAVGSLARVCAGTGSAPGTGWDLRALDAYRKEFRARPRETPHGSKGELHSGETKQPDAPWAGCESTGPSDRARGQSCLRVLRVSRGVLFPNSVVPGSGSALWLGEDPVPNTAHFGSAVGLIPFGPST